MGAGDAGAAERNRPPLGSWFALHCEPAGQSRESAYLANPKR